MLTRNEELVAFVQQQYSQIGDTLYSTEPRTKVPETDQLVIYENKNQNILLTYSYKGAFQGWVYLYVNEKQFEIFSKLLDFVKYLELCKRKGRRIERIEQYFVNTSLIEELEVQTRTIDYESEEGTNESPTQKSKLKSFLLEEERIVLDEEVQLKIPNRLIVDGKEWDLENFSYKTANQILEKLYSGQYTRIEISYREFYERKGRMLPLNMTSLVYLCEEGKAVMEYYEEKKLYAGIFFENRNQAGRVDSDLLPRTYLREKEFYEQNIILNRGVLGSVCLEMLLNGCVDYDMNAGFGRKEGHFSIRYFSNKNAYIKHRDEKGEF